MARDTDHTLEAVLEAAERGVTKAGAAKMLGCTWNTVDSYCKRWKSVDDAFRNKRRELVDLAEMGLRSAVLKQEPWAIAFALKTLGKDEGYAERTEHTGPSGGPIRISEILVERPVMPSQELPALPANPLLLETTP